MVDKVHLVAPMWKFILMDLIKQKLDDLREGYIDMVIAVTALTGITSFTFAFIRDYGISVGFGYLVRIFILGCIIGVYLFRKSLSSNSKSIIVVIALTAFFVTSITGLGFFSPMKLFIVFGAISLTFVLPGKWAVLWVIILTCAYAVSAATLIHDLRPYRLEPEYLVTNMSHWLADLSFTLMSGITVIYIVNSFRIKLSETSSELDGQNSRLENYRSEMLSYNSDQEKLIAESTQDLAVLVEEYAARNRELKAINVSAQQQNEKLSAATDKMKLVRGKLVLSDRLTSLGLLTAGVCHEIRNPLNHIQASVTLLEQHFRKSGGFSDSGKLLEILKNGVVRIKAITDSLNQFDHVSYDAEEYADLVLVVQNCRRILSHLFNERVAFRFIHPHQHIRLKLSADVLHQIVLNILRNALESLPGSGEVSVEILVSADRVIVEIIDNGEGIPPENLPLVTEPFFSTKPTDQHTGLGLFHVQKILSDLGGRLTIESDPGEGTVVRAVFTTSPVCSDV